MVQELVKKLNLYYFGDIGEYDEYNPALVSGKEMVSECLYFIAKNEPYSVSEKEMGEALKIDELKIGEIIKSLKRIEAIEEKGDGFRVTFPVILEKDIKIIDEYSRELGKQVAEKIIDMKEFIYEKASRFKCTQYCSMERMLYHVICDKIFDGSAFEFFSEREIFIDSREQPGGRNYIIVAYEDSDSLSEFSNNLLCSSNNYRVEEYVFNSFGDSMGDRKDMYRFSRKVQSAVHSSSSWEGLNTQYNKILDHKNKEMALGCGKLISRLSSESIRVMDLENMDKLYFDFMREMEYLRENEEGLIETCIPIFYSSELEGMFCEISDVILENIFDLIKESFEEFEGKSGDITAMKHGVNIKEVSNELWHQVFGAANEYLTESGFVQAPVHIEGEGRYLRSITIK